MTNSPKRPDAITPLRAERSALLELLSGLSPEQWALPTECPRWTVHGVALHLLGDDISLLSRQRDSEPIGLIEVAKSNTGLNFLELLHRFNERWVDAGPFISPRVLVELLRVTGELTADFYDAIDPEALGEPVFWLSPQPAPYWQIAAREYGERWVHHHQISRAVGVAGPFDNTLRHAALDSVMPVFAIRFAGVEAPDDSPIVIDAGDVGRWSFIRVDGAWVQCGNAIGAPFAELVIPRASIGPVFSKGLTADEIVAAIDVRANTIAGGVAARAIADFLGRTS